MSAGPKTRHGTIIAIREADGAQCVACDDGEVEWLLSIARVKDGREGQKIVLDYRQAPYGNGWFWFGRPR